MTTTSSIEDEIRSLAEQYHTKVHVDEKKTYRLVHDKVMHYLIRKFGFDCVIETLKKYGFYAPFNTISARIADLEVSGVLRVLVQEDSTITDEGYEQLLKDFKSKPLLDYYLREHGLTFLVPQDVHTTLEALDPSIEINLSGDETESAIRFLLYKNTDLEVSDLKFRGISFGPCKIDSVYKELSLENGDVLLKFEENGDVHIEAVFRKRPEPGVSSRGVSRVSLEQIGELAWFFASKLNGYLFVDQISHHLVCVSSRNSSYYLYILLNGCTIYHKKFKTCYCGYSPRRLPLQKLETSYRNQRYEINILALLRKLIIIREGEVLPSFTSIIIPGWTLEVVLEVLKDIVYNQKELCGFVDKQIANIVMKSNGDGDDDFGPSEHKEEFWSKYRRLKHHLTPETSSAPEIQTSLREMVYHFLMFYDTHIDDGGDSEMYECMSSELYPYLVRIDEETKNSLP